MDFVLETKVLVRVRIVQLFPLFFNFISQSPISNHSGSWRALSCEEFPPPVHPIMRDQEISERPFHLGIVWIGYSLRIVLVIIVLLHVVLPEVLVCHPIAIDWLPGPNQILIFAFAHKCILHYLPINSLFSVLLSSPTGAAILYFLPAYFARFKNKGILVRGNNVITEHLKVF